MIDSQGSRREYSGDVLATTFVAAGYLALAIFVLHYLVAYKPRDAVDSVVLRWPRWCFRKLRDSIPGRPAVKWWSSSRIASSLEGWLRLCLVDLADIQGILGFMLLYQLYPAVGPDEVISAAQWQFVIHLAWFPVIVGLCSISVLSSSSTASTAARTTTKDNNGGGSRSSSFFQDWPKLARVVVLAAMVGSVLVSIAPTVFFDWESRRENKNDAVEPSTDTWRFRLDFTGGEWWQRFRYHDVGTSNLSDTHGFQLAVLSAVALLSVTLLVLGKAVAACTAGYSRQQTTSSGTTTIINERGIRLEDLEDLDDIESANVGVRPKPRTVGGIFSDAAVFFVTFNLDLLTSRLAEIFFLFVLQFWGVARLYGSVRKSSGQIPNGQALWRFSQQLPVVLLIVPLIMATNSYFLGGSVSSSPAGYQGVVAEDAGEQEEGVTTLPVSSSSPTGSSGQQENENDDDDDDEEDDAVAAAAANLKSYYPTPWVGVSLVCGCGLLLSVTIGFFAATFNMMMGFEPQFLPSEALFTVIGLFWVVFPGYPVACFATALAGYAMERSWIHKRRGSDNNDDDDDDQDDDADTTTTIANRMGSSEFSRSRVGDYIVLFVLGAALHAFGGIVLIAICMGTKK